jgi:diacylglycerol diphosphate phosphatase/phosphatidate phosphatase
MLFLYSIGIPFAVILIALIVFRAASHKFHVSLLGLAISLVLASSLTNLGKNSIGRPRPDFLDRCKARPGTPQSSLVGIDVCTETNAHTLQDGWRSFPSGHSSFSFSGLGYLALWGAGQLHVFRPHANLLRGLLCLLPIIAAAGIAISRTEDYRHDAYDVTAGSLLGITVAYVSYRRYFPTLTSGLCDSPIPRRTDSMPLKQRDEEVAVHDGGEFELADDDGSDHFPLNGGS